MRNCAGTTGRDIEDVRQTPHRTIAECLLHHLIEHDDALDEEDKLFSRPLVVTAPKGYFVCKSSGPLQAFVHAVPAMLDPTHFGADARLDTGGFAVAPYASGRDKQGVFKVGKGKDMRNFVLQKWKLSDLSKDTMQIIVAKSGSSVHA
jgi:hypothetical protein